MIFLKKKFWHDCGVYPLVEHTAAGRPYREWLTCTDDINEVVKTVVRFRQERRLPVLTLSDFKGRYWERIK